MASLLKHLEISLRGIKKGLVMLIFSCKFFEENLVSMHFRDIEIAIPVFGVHYFQVRLKNPIYA